MSAYTEAPVFFSHVEGRTYRQHGATTWELGWRGSAYRFTIHDGTTFDVSVPWWLTWLLDPHDPRYFKAAALHDELLIAGCDRITAAGAFNQALLADGVGRWERFRATAAVAFYRFE